MKEATYKTNFTNIQKANILSEIRTGEVDITGVMKMFYNRIIE